MNNTINHVSDKSVYVTFDPAGTQWPSTFKNVQQALAAIGPWARTDVGLPNAAPGVRGIAAIATQAMIDAGTDTQTIVTPALLEYRLQNPHASQTVWGYTRYATDAESVTTTNDLVSLTPRSLNYVFNTRQAKENVWGSAKLSTTAQATSGTDDTTAMTPLKVKQAISALVPVQANATESSFGLVQLATVAEVRAGTIRDGFAISPYTFIRLTASESDLGLLRIATQAEVNAGTDNTKAITPQKLAAVKGSGSAFGMVKLTTDINPGLANTALSAGANVVPSNKNSAITGGALYQGSITVDNKYQTKTDVDANIPIGCMMLAAFNSDVGNLYICNGRAMNRNSNPDLFARIGYTYGGAGDIFNLPDMRGVAARGFDAGRGLDPGRGFGTYQDDMFESHGHDLELIFNNGGNIPRNDAMYELKGAEKNDQRVVRFDNRYTRAVPVGGSETRMKNVAVNYVIRVR